MNITNWGEAMLASIAGALAMFFTAIPKIIGFVIILVAGWFIASAIGKVIGILLRKVKFNELAQRSGFADFVSKTGTDTDASGMIALICKWFIRLIVLIVAFDALGLPAVSNVLSSLLLWLPNVVVELVALVIGGLAANALSNVVRAAAAKGGLENPAFLGKVASVAVWAFAIVVAVNQLGIATTLINTLFMATVGAVALALGISFGLGGKDTAAEIVRKWYGKAQEQKSRIAATAQSAGDIARAKAEGTAHAIDEAVPPKNETGPDAWRH